MIRTDNQGDTLWTKVVQHITDAEFMDVAVNPDTSMVFSGYRKEMLIPIGILIWKNMIKMQALYGLVSTPYQKEKTVMLKILLESPMGDIHFVV